MHWWPFGSQIRFVSDTVKYLEPTRNIGSTKAERMSCRLGLSFHIEGGLLIPHGGWQDRVRDASEEEQEMWNILCPEDAEEYLCATPDEITCSLRYQEGPFTVNPKDATTIRQMFPFGNVSIYASDFIPPGYYLAGARIRELHEENGVENLPEHVRQAARRLRPFMKVG